MAVELSKRAMLLSLTLRLEGLLGERRDRSATELVESTYGVASRRAKASKYLIDRKHESVRAVIAQAQQVRNAAYRYSFPWGESGLRLLPVKAHAEFSARVNAALADLDAAQAHYLSVYEELVQASKKELGALFDAKDYPPLAEIKNRFRASVEYWPMPESGHFVADIATEAAMMAKASIEAETVKRTQDAVSDLILRIEKILRTYIDRLSGYQNNDNAVGVFRDSLVHNVEAMGKLVRSLNFLDDPSLDILAYQIERIARVSAQELREDATTRKSMINEGQAIINRLDSFRKAESEIDEMLTSVADYSGYYK